MKVGILQSLTLNFTTSIISSLKIKPQMKLLIFWLTTFGIDKNTGLKGGSKMNNCTICRLLTEVAGGSELIFFCKVKNEEITYPTLCGRFCKQFVLKEEEVD